MNFINFMNLINSMNLMNFFVISIYIEWKMMKTLIEFGETGNMLIAAHRGSSGNAPENTFSAFRLAYEEGANMIETDLQFTSDNHIVAVHDLRHFAGQDISNIHSLDDFKKLDAGTWFHEKFKGEKIPLLEEILEFAKDKLYLNLELKVNEKPVETRQIEVLLDIIYKFGFEKHLMFSSFSQSLLKLIKSIDSSILTAVINIPGNITIPSQFCRETFADAFICSYSEINDDINNDSIENNVFIGVYSV